MKPRLSILIVEDDESTRQMLLAALQDDGHFVQTTCNIREFLDLLPSARPDLIILDRGLPDGDGIQLAMRIRRDPVFSSVGMLILTGKAEPVDKVLGLRLGADDYLTKPFVMDELLARVYALARRSRGGVFAAPQLACGGIVMDVPARRVIVDGEEIHLTGKEYDLLRVMLERSDSALSREFLLDTVWRDSSGRRSPKVIDVTVMALRRKLGRAGDRIVALRSEGYMLKRPPG